MPNWCEQDLYITTTEGEDWKDHIPELKEFKEHANGTTRYGEETVLYEGHFIPYPLEYAIQDSKVQTINKHYNDFARSEGVFQMSESEKSKWYQNNPRPRDKDGFNQGGYEWCCENYGSKWGISRPSLEEEDLEWGTLKYVFESAWAPVFPLIEKMSKMFPNLKFDLRYFEQGMAFHGMKVYKAGEVIDEYEGKYYGTRGG